MSSSEADVENLKSKSVKSKLLGLDRVAEISYYTCIEFHDIYNNGSLSLKGEITLARISENIN